MQRSDFAEIHPSLAAFLASPEGADATPEELRFMLDRLPDVSATVKWIAGFLVEDQPLLWGLAFKHARRELASAR